MNTPSQEVMKRNDGVDGEEVEEDTVEDVAENEDAVEEDDAEEESDGDDEEDDDSIDSEDENYPIYGFAYGQGHYLDNIGLNDRGEPTVAYTGDEYDDDGGYTSDESRNMETTAAMINTLSTKLEDRMGVFEKKQDETLEKMISIDKKLDELSATMKKLYGASKSTYSKVKSLSHKN